METPVPKKSSKKLGDVLTDYDIVVLNSEIYYGISKDFSLLLRDKLRSPRKTVLVLITTRGGSPDDAFKMMRLLQSRYNKVEVLLMGGCYSAGTLFTLGANVIYMTQDSNLGPLDVQIPKEDDWMRMSGECYSQALAEMNETARVVFNRQFSALKSRRDILMSTATASKIASEITVGLLSPITSQIEPGRLGEVMRSQRIGDSYARRLMQGKYQESVITTAARKLAMGYPSHSTVIDYQEAKALGLNVRLVDVSKDFEGAFAYLESYMYDQESRRIFDVFNDVNIGEETRER